MTGSDVKFSLLALTSATAGNVIGILDVTLVPGPSSGTQTVVVHLGSRSPFAIYNVGSMPIIPQHVWAADTSTTCATKGTAPCTANPTLASADTVTNHLLIGSGPWVCADLATGQIGGGCTRNASGGTGSSFVDAGGTIVLQRNGFGFPGYDTVHSYVRDSRFYKNFLWADRLGQGTVNIVDVSDFGGCYGKSVSAYPRCAHWDGPSATVTCASTAGSCNAGSLTNTALGGNNNGIVDSVESSQVGALWQVSWNAPIVYTTFVGAQPAPQALYEGGAVYSGSAPP